MLRTTVMTATTALILSLSACSGGDAPAKKVPELVTPKAGQCIAKEVSDGKDVAPDTESVIPCDKPHSYEIAAAIKIPQELLGGKTKKAKLARRAELADIDADKSKLRQELFKTVYRKCDQPFRKASGLDKLTVLGKSAKETSLRLSAHASEWYTISSPKLWLQGKTMLVCSVRYQSQDETKGRAKLSTVRSSSAKPVIASYLTKDFPISARRCTDSDTKASSDCALPHGQELLWSIDIKAVYGKKFLSGADLTDVNADQLTKIRAACNDPYEQTGGKVSEARPMGFRFYSEIPTTGSSLPIICVRTARDNNLGSTFTAF